MAEPSAGALTLTSGYGSGAATDSGSAHGFSRYEAFGVNLHTSSLGIARINFGATALTATSDFRTRAGQAKVLTTDAALLAGADARFPLVAPTISSIGLELGIAYGEALAAHYVTRSDDDDRDTSAATGSVIQGKLALAIDLSDSLAVLLGGSWTRFRAEVSTEHQAPGDDQIFADSRTLTYTLRAAMIGARWQP